MLGSDGGIKMGSTGGKVPGTILINVDGITLGTDVGTDLGSYMDPLMVLMMARLMAY